MLFGPVENIIDAMPVENKPDWEAILRSRLAKRVMGLRHLSLSQRQRLLASEFEAAVLATESGQPLNAPPPAAPVIETEEESPTEKPAARATPKPGPGPGRAW